MPGRVADAVHVDRQGYVGEGSLACTAHVLVIAHRQAFLTVEGDEFQVERQRRFVQPLRQRQQCGDPACVVQRTGGVDTRVEVRHHGHPLQENAGADIANALPSAAQSNWMTAFPDAAARGTLPPGSTHWPAM